MRWVLALLAACPALPPADDPAPPSDDTEPGGDDTAPPITPGTPAQVHAVPGPPCADPGARERQGAFRPATASDTWGDHTPRPDRSLFTGAGVAAADLDGDGRLDLLVARTHGLLAYRQREDGAFEDASSWLPATDAVAAAVPADMDGDGDPDLAVTRYGAPDLLWRNDGGTFTDVTAASGVVGAGKERSASASWADWDRDGDLDLFLAAHGGLDGVHGDPSDGSRLYLGHGDGTFEAAPPLPDAVRYAHAFAGGWHDLDGDGWLDLYVVADFGQHRRNALLWNRAGTLVADGGAAGLDVVVQGMGLGVGDVDGDDAPDVVVAGWGSNRLLLAHEGRWFEAHKALALVPDPRRGQHVGWATELADLDADGDLDVIEGFGAIVGQDTPPAQPDEVYRNDGGRFVPVGSAWGFDDTGRTRAVLPVDVDGDGWLDLLRGDQAGPATLHLARCGAAAWVSVRLSQPGANPDAIGAEVTVRAGERLWRRTVVAGSTGVLSGGPPVVHVGLGELDRIDRITVRWPDGTRSTAGSVAVRQHLHIVRSSP